MSALRVKQIIEKSVSVKQAIMQNDSLMDTIFQVSETITEALRNDHHVWFCGNGGSAAIASHVCVDLTKQGGIRSVNFNEADLITCFSNDYGYEKWIEKAIEFYGSKGDILILISSSGKSKNMLNACKAARRKKIQKIITFTVIIF